MQWRLDSNWRIGKILASTLTERFGKLDDLVGSTLFLLSNEEAGFITGITLPIDVEFSLYNAFNKFQLKKIN